MKQGPLSSLQFAVLGTLRAGSLTGRTIRQRLAELGMRKTGPGFYQLMSRLEDAELVEGWYTQEIVDGQIIRERNYRLRGTGSRVWERHRDLQLQIIRSFDDAKSPAGA